MMEPDYALDGDGFRQRQNGTVEAIEEVQICFYPDGHISGSFVCRTAESSGILWLFQNGSISGGTLRFDMVHIQLRYPRDPVASFIGDYDGEGTYAGTWSSPIENGQWKITLRGPVKPHSPGPHWYS
jgi:hypothetical protein